jgi:predicted nuclease of predicted toxin-antitoxin system
MRFLADESCDFRVVRTLRAAGHDVTAVLEESPGAEDEAVIALARREERVLITEDRDFGQLFYAATRPTCGVVLLRFPSNARNSMLKAVTDLVEERGAALADRFVVAEPGRVRIGRQP